MKAGTLEKLGRICQIIFFFLTCQILVPLCFSFSFSFSLSYASVNSAHYSIKILVVLPSLCTHHTPTPTLFRQEKKKSILKAVSFFFLPPLNITLISYHIALRFFLPCRHTHPLASSPSPRQKEKGKKVIILRIIYPTLRLTKQLVPLDQHILHPLYNLCL